MVSIFKKTFGHVRLNINLNSAAFKFNILYKFLSNKKVAQDFGMPDFSLTLVL